MSLESKPLSASKLKTYQTCSWQYWTRYELGIPDKTNTGALAGSCCHTIFECLLNVRHRKIFDAITSPKITVRNSKSVERYINQYIKKNGMDDEWFNKIDAMIVVGLLADFFCEKGKGVSGKILEPELAFNIQNKNPKYHIKGFMDKPVQYGENFIRIIDYKSSKKKFEGDELKVNVQAMMYSLAAKALWPSLKPVVDFIFLQYGEDPIQRLSFTDGQLRGFETFLSDVYFRTNNFTELDAKSNFASDQGFPKEGEGFKGLLVCGYAKKPGQLKKDGNVMYHCPVKFPFDYWELCNEDGERITSSLTNNLKPNKEKNEFVVKKHYSGCPKFNKPQRELF